MQILELKQAQVLKLIESYLVLFVELVVPVKQTDLDSLIIGFSKTGCIPFRDLKVWANEYDMLFSLPYNLFDFGCYALLS